VATVAAKGERIEGEVGCGGLKTASEGKE